MRDKTWIILLFVGVIIVIIFGWNNQNTKNDSSIMERVPPHPETFMPDMNHISVSSESKVSEKDETFILPQNKIALNKEDVGAVSATEDPKKETDSAQITNIVKESYFAIQVASFKDKKRADNVLKDAQEKGYDAYIVSSDLGKEKGVWYRVYIGRFNQKISAQELLIKVREDYKDSFIILVEKES